MGASLSSIEIALRFWSQVNSIRCGEALLTNLVSGGICNPEPRSRYSGEGVSCGDDESIRTTFIATSLLVKGRRSPSIPQDPEQGAVSQSGAMELRRHVLANSEHHIGNVAGCLRMDMKEHSLCDRSPVARSCQIQPWAQEMRGHGDRMPPRSRYRSGATQRRADVATPTFMALLDPGAQAAGLDDRREISASDEA